MPAWLDNAQNLLAQNAQLGLWMMGFSVLALLATIIALPWFVAALPANYFTQDNAARDVKDYIGLRAIIVLAAKNVLGLILILAGIAMLVLPGQGLLTLLAGLVLCDFPGKHALTLALVKRPIVLASLNRMRRAKQKPEFWLDKPPA
ncbi:MAG: hypothetical protein KJP25_00335 [Gammaproteobacteria bacterium]|nr:hypothetical protein [Gammaproteobacteria bacterium]NND38655.1 hypothetical protein [Pseudomonadales bacterium]MBT8151623.1 hypothetical protein [Gammaproteobacteria bacterium]NNL10877.1 hypothetical protein [Pseudomonadales bacterium]NNM11733.1 hypothetical protein [Pseudomonadales bacterium]